MRKPARRQPAGKQPDRFVVEISTSRHFGGPEEGGWWYDHTDVNAVHVCPNRTVARRLRRALEREAARYRPRHNRFSVLGGADHGVASVRSRAEVEEMQTRGRPHYC